MGTEVFELSGAMIEVIGVEDGPGDGLPGMPQLHGNYPNPFNPRTTIEFSLPRSTSAKLAIFDLRGNQVRSLVQGSLPAGWQSVVWDGKNDAGMVVSAGGYLCQLLTDQGQNTIKLQLIK